MMKFDRHWVVPAESGDVYVVASKPGSSVIQRFERLPNGTLKFVGLRLLQAQILELRKQARDGGPVRRDLRPAHGTRAAGTVLEVGREHVREQPGPSLSLRWRVVRLAEQRELIAACGRGLARCYVGYGLRNDEAPAASRAPPYDATVAVVARDARHKVA